MDEYGVPADGKRWWYQFKDGSYAVGWHWLQEGTTRHRGMVSDDQGALFFAEYDRIKGRYKI